MITEWINALEAVLEGLVILLLQVMYLFVLAACAVGMVAVLFLPLIILYCKYLDRLDALAKQRPPGDPANAADAEQVKGRAPGSSDHASPIRRTEARAERTLEHPPP
ncbi:hypothetical protein RTH74_10770 [Pseudomonas sp. zfem001]|uniref:hypothetical protein n=1 Tax=Pseudomonas sp. zfem001 TaxID=3078196 RepID=UPI0029287AD0|nr:hypothetical protein [Pseudomonas sp. zfem001]MDU9408078.1 hypothetical protein [Pseudomonas sp. zfem001]